MNKLELTVPPIIQVVILAAIMWVLADVLAPFSMTLAVLLPVAVIAALIGVAFSLLGVYEFHSAGTTVDPRLPEESASLVTHGVYKVSRNPMYVGFLLILIGWGIYLGNIVNIMLPVVFVLYMNRFQIVPEERYMQQKFGHEYSEYKKAVRRWI